MNRDDSRRLLVEAKEIIAYVLETFGRSLTRVELWKYSRWAIHPFPVLPRKPGKKPRLVAWSDEVDLWCQRRGWVYVIEHPGNIRGG